MTLLFLFNHKLQLATLLAFLAAGFISSIVFLLSFQSSHNKSPSSDLKGKVRNANKFPHSPSKPPILSEHGLALSLGDLPGYTGWSRPSETLAGWFDHPITTAQENLFVHQNATFQIHCASAACSNGGSLFFVRAYGRAVLPGRLVDHRNGTYDIVVFPFDAGIYSLEVVLSFSAPPSFDAFPLPTAQEQPAYEGYLLPGFPLQFEVKDSNNGTHSSNSLPRCTSRDLLETGEARAIEKGRWRVKDKVHSQRSPFNGPQGKERASLLGYQKGENSLGIRMVYAPRRCKLLPFDQFRKAFQCAQGKYLHLVFIGDSNSRMQKEAFDAYWEVQLKGQKGMATLLPNITTTRIQTNNGLHATLPTIADQLEALGQAAQADLNTEYFILFNSGLHDIDQSCSRPLSPQNIMPEVSCTVQYQATLLELAELVDAFPAAKLRVFQTTTAGWPRYGNFGFAWPPTSQQMLPKDPTFVEHFNQAAWKVLLSSKIAIMDAYWLTLARPDHRQVDIHNSIGKHLVHGGPEVVDVLVRQWITMVLESVCGENY